MNTLEIGFAMTGSFCTLARALEEMKRLTTRGHHIIPIFSEHVATMDTRFGTAQSFLERAEEISGRPVLRMITEVEPLGPKAMTEVLIVAPCTGNTLGKLALGITDTTVTMAVKSHLRQRKPVVLAVSTNDALSASAQNIGRLMNVRNVYFVPFAQDSPQGKPNSLVADFSQILQTVEAAMQGKQLQPLILSSES